MYFARAMVTLHIMITLHVMTTFVSYGNAPCNYAARNGVLWVRVGFGLGSLVYALDLVPGAGSRGPNQASEAKTHTSLPRYAAH